MSSINKIILVFLLAISFCAVVSYSVQAAGVVPCGGTGINGAPAEQCTLCHLFEGIQNIVSWGKSVLVIIALVAIVAGAIMYVISAGNSGMMELGRNVIKQALWGVVITLAAWLIVNTILWLMASKLTDGGDNFLSIASWYDFQCSTEIITPGAVSVSSTKPNADGTCNPGYHLSQSGQSCLEDAPPVPDGTNAVNSVGENGVRNTLSENGITVNRPNACNPGQTSGCTDVGNLRENSINGIIDFKKNCGDDCPIMLNGGSEGNKIHNENGVYNHINGYKVDIAPNAQVDNYITNNPDFTRIPGTRSDGATGYRDKAGNTYYREKTHWDVTYF